MAAVLGEFARIYQVSVGDGVPAVIEVQRLRAGQILISAARSQRSTESERTSTMTVGLMIASGYKLGATGGD